jgi:putative DNA primase/helicase
VAAKHCHELRYVAQMGQWFRWNGHCWAEDRTIAVFDLIRPYVREVALTYSTEAQRRQGARGAIIASVERILQTDRRIAALVDDFDQDPYLLNTPDGIVDLQTGKLRPSDPAAMCSKVTSVGPAHPGTRAPRFEQFLEEITGYDRDAAEKRAYMQRVAGYALMAGNPDQALIFGLGTGANGKSVFIELLADILGNYAVTVASSLFMTSFNERHPVELACLRGARLLVSSELNKGQRWDEAKINQLTGDKRVQARFMRENPFTFTPLFLPFIIGNHPPNLRNVNEAIKRRFNMLPFTVTIPLERRDKGLAAKLRAEWPAILRWAIDGFLKWQRIGLAPPRCVTGATEKYMAEQDLLGQWLEEKCVKDVNAAAQVTELYASWTSWAASRSEKVDTCRAFSGELENRGFDKKLKNTGTFFLGLRVGPAISPELAKSGEKQKVTQLSSWKRQSIENKEE